MKGGKDQSGIGDTDRPRGRRRPLENNERDSGVVEEGRKRGEGGRKEGRESRRGSQHGRPEEEKEKRMNDCLARVHGTFLSNANFTAGDVDLLRRARRIHRRRPVLPASDWSVGLSAAADQNAVSACIACIACIDVLTYLRQAGIPYARRSPYACVLWRVPDLPVPSLAGDETVGGIVLEDHISLRNQVLIIEPIHLPCRLSTVRATRRPHCLSNGPTSAVDPVG